MAENPNFETPFLDSRSARLWWRKPQPILDQPRKLMSQTLETASELNLTVVQKCRHRFTPYGLSIVLVIAESDLSVHTWPEKRFMYYRVTTCSPDTQVFRLDEILKGKFDPDKIEIKVDDDQMNDWELRNGIYQLANL